MTTATAGAMLPATLQWYRDGANWLVGLSTGAIAASIAYYEKFAAGDRWAIAFLLLGIAFFMLCVLTGIFFYLWVITYGNQRESSDHLRASVQAAMAAGNTTAQADLQDKLNASDSQKASALRRVQSLWQPMLWSFFIGVVALAISAARYIADPRPDMNWSLQSVSADPPSAGERARSLVLRIDAKSGETWLLCTPAGQIPFWHSLMSEKTQSVISRPASTAPGCVPVSRTDVFRETIWFGTADHDLSPAAHGSIRRASAYAKERPAMKVSLAAYTDSTGSPAYNRKLAHERGEAVRQALLSEGIAPERIAVLELASARLPYPSGNNVREPGNRVVIVTVE